MEFGAVFGGLRYRLFFIHFVMHYVWTYFAVPLHPHGLINWLGSDSVGDYYRQILQLGPVLFYKSWCRFVTLYMVSKFFIEKLYVIFVWYNR